MQAFERNDGSVGCVAVHHFLDGREKRELGLIDETN